MSVFCFRVAIVLAGACCFNNASHAAEQCRGSKLYTYCTDNIAFLRGQCSAYPEDSRTPCMVNADRNVQYTCQRYRVPCGFEGTFFDNLGLAQYPKVGPASPPRPGFAPLDAKSYLLH